MDPLNNEICIKIPTDWVSFSLNENKQKCKLYTGVYIVNDDLLHWDIKLILIYI